MGSLALLMQIHSFRQYSSAMTQALNETLAQHLASQYLPSLRAATLATPESTATVKSQLEALMSVNPGIELYLLDGQGNILTYTARPAEVRRARVDLGPIHDFLAHRFVFPLLNDDPRSPAARKIFSAAALDGSDPAAGYLYIILDRSEYESATRRLENKLTYRSAFMVIAAGIAVALIAGFVVLLTITRRLRLLAQAIDMFRSSQFQSQAAVHVGGLLADDEIDRLGVAYNSMITHIQAQMLQIAQSNTLRRDLIAGVSHDLRTPLASLRGYLETLLMKEDTLSGEDRRRYLTIATAQSSRLHQLVEELFELAKLDDVEVRMTLESFQLSEIVQDVVQKFALMAREREVEVNARYTPNAPLLSGDISLIERLLDNLLENAIRHTSRGGKVTVSVSAGDGNPTLQVADTGSGIPADALPHIFERFYHVDRARGPTTGGAGLGLAIAKRIVELHRGTITARSTIGVGTTFSIEFPAP